MDYRSRGCGAIADWRAERARAGAEPVPWVALAALAVALGFLAGR